ncbi:MT-A70 family methyltransferase [Aestuariivirga sp. YIM B02566]|uniref:S-adenosylmethionine-binding protein n=1 Tax=Taklimakanibacter albus TaxID=2800327 RepID=A0ACC5R6I2_9HYPH|nr:MT-A70 family methyltransferase [Aestuariivirga sp. YIM B02566]MBK1868276.1 S-adenosylmethionine-binding protein [Aestuariivirga sp. YIM B02566]
MTGWPFDNLKPLSYGVILADFPWRYKMRSSKGYGRSPEAHYKTMPDEEILNLPVSQLARGDCVYIMWAIWPRLPFALEVMKRHGFKYKTGGSWLKLTKTGKTAMGGGYILRSSCEPFIIGTIGSPTYGSRSIKNSIESLRREHSRKPPEMRELITRLLPTEFGCELFATEQWPGYDVWGDQLGKYEEAA